MTGHLKGMDGVPFCEVNRGQFWWPDSYKLITEDFWDPTSPDYGGAAVDYVHPGFIGWYVSGYQLAHKIGNTDCTVILRPCIEYNPTTYKNFTDFSLGAFAPNFNGTEPGYAAGQIQCINMQDGNGNYNGLTLCMILAPPGHENFVSSLVGIHWRWLAIAFPGA
jgi:hypothetical protein